MRYWQKIFYFSILLSCIGGSVFFGLRVWERDRRGELKETDRFKESVGALVDLPKNEEPILLTIEDVKKLDPRIFPHRVDNGDQLVVYRLNKWVLLFRPKTGKIIESASFPSGGGIDSEILSGMNDESAATVPLTLSLYIATHDTERVADVERILKEEFPLLSINARENANYSDYRGIFIFNPSYFQSEISERLAERLNGIFEETIPLGEKIPSTDLLVIVGEK